MENKIHLAIVTARNLKTSSGSNNTVLNILNNLDESKYKIDILLIDDLVPISLRISKENLKKVKTYVSFKLIKNNKKVLGCYHLSQLSLSKIQKKYDAAIVAIYNNFGEDGKLLGLLDTIGIPYIGPGLKASVVCFDKTITKAILQYNDILVPRGIQINKDQYNYNNFKKLIENSFNYPFIVKTASCGASWGVSLITDKTQLQSAIKEAFKFSEDVLIEEYIKGDEFTVGVVGNHVKPTVLPVVLIKTKNAFFDYEAKYTQGLTKEICPAPISKNLEIRLKNTALAAYRAVKAESHSRIDMIVSGDNIYVLEINTFPGLTSSSIFPKELIATGSSLSQFLDKNIRDKLKGKKLINSTSYTHN